MPEPSSPFASEASWKPVALFDLNVVLDVLQQREPHYGPSARVWAAVEAGYLRGFVAAHSVTTLFYLLVRHLGWVEALSAIHDVLAVFSVARVDETVIRAALALGWKDFEDAVQMTAAIGVGAELLVTRNPKDFKSSPIPVMRPAEVSALADSLLRRERLHRRSRSEESTDPASYVRPELRRLAEYHLDLTPCEHKLDQNEVPFDLPRRVKEKVAARWLERDWARYPDFHGDDLRRMLGERHDWPFEGVLAGNGSNELLGVVLEGVVHPGQEVLIHVPSFGLYPMFVLRAGGVVRAIGPSPDAALPVEALAAALEENPRRPMILCTPNNPTGDAISPEAVEGLLERIEAPLLLDNAYAEFCRFDYRPLLDRHPHLVLLRTFSKAWSLAGQRLGYLLADPRLVAELIKVKLPYNLGHASAIAGEEALAAAAACERRIRVILGRRPQWTRMLEGFGFEVFPSEANFLLARHPRAEEIRLGLETRDVRARNVSGYPGLAGCLRFSVGSGRDLRATERALRQILESESRDEP